MITTAPAIEFIIQHQEDWPGNPGWWRWSRPEHKIGAEPEFSDHTKVWYGDSDDAARAQSEWDATHS